MRFLSRIEGNIRLDKLCQSLLLRALFDNRPTACSCLVGRESHKWQSLATNKCFMFYKRSKIKEKEQEKNILPSCVIGLKQISNRI